MSQQNLDDANVHASLQQVRGEAVPQRLRPKTMVEPALASRLDESSPRGAVRQRRDGCLTGKQPTPVRRLFQPPLAAFANYVQERLFGVDRRDRKLDRFYYPQTVGVNEREAAAVNGALQRGD